MNLNAAQVQSYRDQGYLVVPEVFAPDQAEAMIGHSMELRAQGTYPGDSGGTDDQPDDPNHTYPRMINMHDWDPASATWATRPDLLAAVEQLIDDEPVLRQTMLYFKPPGGRGQGLHQDEQYITINPLIGLWIALDPSDNAVGQMVVVPGSHGQLRPVEKADTNVSFTRAQSQLPPEAAIVGLDMAPGDGLFFDGKTIHGSYPNQTADRWRRSFICHYIGKRAEHFEPPQGFHVAHV